MNCVNLATLLFHTGKKRLLLTPSFIKRIAIRFSTLKEELRAREASNALYGLKCMSSECPEVKIYTCSLTLIVLLLLHPSLLYRECISHVVQLFFNMNNKKIQILFKKPLPFPRAILPQKFPTLPKTTPLMLIFWGQ